MARHRFRSWHSGLTFTPLGTRLNDDSKTRIQQIWSCSQYDTYVKVMLFQDHM